MSENVFEFDFSRYESSLNVWALEEYIKILEIELPRLLQEERQRIWKNVKLGDEQQEHYADIAELQLVEGVTTRLLTGTALVAIWATYQSVVTQTARRIQKSRELQTELDTSRAFLKNARKYFDSELGIELHPSDTDWDKLSVVNVLRNAFGHANGQLEDVRDSDRKRIEEWANTFDGLKISGGYLVVSIDFVRRAFDFVSGLLNELEDRVNRLAL